MCMFVTLLIISTSQNDAQCRGSQMSGFPIMIRILDARDANHAFVANASHKGIASSNAVLDGMRGRVPDRHDSL